MALRILIGVLLYTCVLLAGGQISSAQPIFYTALSLEWQVAASDVVVRATIVDVQRQRARDHYDWVTLTLDVHEMLKGKDRETLTFVTSAHSTDTRFEKRRDATREYLWFLTHAGNHSGGGEASPPDAHPPLVLLDSSQSMIRLGPPVEPRPVGLPEHRIITAELDGLIEPKELLSAARAAAQFDAGRAGKLESHRMDVMGIRRIGPQPGTHIGVLLPVDRRLESLAHRLIQAPEEFLGAKPDDAQAQRAFADGSQSLIYEGVKALRYFNSPQNAELLRRFLDHPASWHRRGDGLAAPAFREYYIRKEAFDILTEWGIHVDEPVLNEPLIDPAQAPSAAAVAAVHGPTMELTSVDLLIELGGDSTPELLRLFVDARRGLELPRSGDEFKGSLVQGFTLFTWAEGEPVLVFHAANEFDGFSLTLREVEGRPMLISEGGRDHMQYAWGRRELWDSGIEIWAAQCRSVKVEPETWQEGWHDLPLIHSPRSK